MTSAKTTNPKSRQKANTAKSLAKKHAADHYSKTRANAHAKNPPYSRPSRAHTPHAPQKFAAPHPYNTKTSPTTSTKSKTQKSKQKANSSNKPATSLATEHSSKMPASTHVKRKPFSPMSNVENTLYNSRSTFGGVAMGDAHTLRHAPMVSG